MHEGEAWNSEVGVKKHRTRNVLVRWNRSDPSAPHLPEAFACSDAPQFLFNIHADEIAAKLSLEIDFTHPDERIVRSKLHRYDGGTKQEGEHTSRGGESADSSRFVHEESSAPLTQEISSPAPSPIRNLYWIATHERIADWLVFARSLRQAIEYHIDQTRCGVDYSGTQMVLREVASHGLNLDSFPCYALPSELRQLGFRELSAPENVLAFRLGERNYVTGYQYAAVPEILDDYEEKRFGVRSRGTIRWKRSEPDDEGSFSF